MPGGDFHPWLFVFLAAWILVCALGVVAFKKVMYSAVSMVACLDRKSTRLNSSHTR